jgi:hypothetical protein
LAGAIGYTSEVKRPDHESPPLFSIVETCRRLSLPLGDYLGSVLPIFADFPSNRVAELTPKAWATRI